jgi:hypothetical protein
MGMLPEADPIARPGRWNIEFAPEWWESRVLPVALQK